MPKLVVVADNVPEVREALRQTIVELYAAEASRGDLRVETYADGSGVVTLCALALPDLVILDVDMPGLDGVQTFYRIREISRVAASRVVFLTGYVGAGNVRARVDRAIADGACGCLPKPASAADIKTLLDSKVFTAPSA